MTDRNRQIISAISALLVLLAVGYLSFLGIRAAWNALTSYNSEITVAIVAGAGTIIVSVVSIVVGKAYEARAQIQKEIRAKKVPVYEELIAFMTRLLASEKVGVAPTEREMLEFMAGFTQRITVWGSDSVLLAWVTWRRAALQQRESRADLVRLMSVYENMILAIRKDLGHKNKDLRRGDILSLNLNDVDEYFPRHSA